MILVGIANTGLRRMAEYTPTRDFKMGGGEGRSYGRLLIEELKPLIDRTYRTLPDAKDTGLGGSSLGGLISLYLGFAHPEVFGKMAVMSPSLWWDHRSILNAIKRAGDEARSAHLAGHGDGGRSAASARCGHAGTPAAEARLAERGRSGLREGAGCGSRRTGMVGPFWRCAAVPFSRLIAGDFARIPCEKPHFPRYLDVGLTMSVLCPDGRLTGPSVTQNQKMF